MKVHLHAPLDVQSGCHQRWRLTEVRGKRAGWEMRCDEHHTAFSIVAECPRAYTTLKPGLVELDEDQAHRLVRLGMATAEQPAPAAPRNQEGLLPINAVFVEHGLPPIDKDLMLSVARALPRPYSAQPRLAADLRVNGDDMEEIIRLARS